MEAKTRELTLQPVKESAADFTAELTLDPLCGLVKLRFHSRFLYTVRSTVSVNPNMDYLGRKSIESAKLVY